MRMKKNILSVTIMTVAIVTGCNKTDSSPTQDFTALKASVITDFVNKVALPAYEQLKIKATTLNTAVTNLNNSTTEANLTIAKDAWKDLRSTWEKCEGFLFGPVADDEHDPETDTWPVNYVDLDALIASNDPLTIASIEALSSRSLKGYHPIEYILWGQNGAGTAASITVRQKLYIVSLTAALKKQAEELYNSWIPSGGNYADKVLKAGNGSSIFPKRQDFFLTLVGDEGMIGICGEVGEGKMKEPFDAQDAQIVESPFSGNSTTDFKNNITGAYNLYLGNFTEDGKGLTDLVKTKNIALDNELQQKFTAAINSFSTITIPYEQAIITQRVQCQNVMAAINDLAAALETKLKPFIIENIKD
jgi:putative iron-regulated protein